MVVILRRLLIAAFAALLLLPLPALAQTSVSGFVGAASTDCSTTNSCVILDLLGSSGTVVVQLSGTFTGTVQFEGTSNGVTWTAVTGAVIGSTTTATSATAGGSWQFVSAGLNRFRVRGSAYTSGRVDTWIQSSEGTLGGAAVSVSVGTSSFSGTITNAAGASAVNIQDGGNSITIDGTVTITDGAGAVNTIVDSGTLTAVTTITNPVTVTDGAGALNTIIDSGTVTTVSTVTAVTTVTNPVTVTDGAGALNVIIDSGTLTSGTVTLASAATGIIVGTVYEPTGTTVLAAALSGTVVTVSASGPRVLDFYFCNNPSTTDWAYVQIFDIAGAVTIGSSTPKFSFGIPAGGSGNVSGINGLFPSAIKVAATTTATGATPATTALNCNFVHSLP